MSIKSKHEKVHLMDYALWIVGMNGKYQTVEQIAELKAGLRLSDEDFTQLLSLIAEVRSLNVYHNGEHDEIPYNHCGATKHRETCLNVHG